MKALVTGANGFIGSALVRELAKRGHKVRALVRSQQKGAALAAPNVEIVIGDVTDASALEKAVAGCDAVFHTAAVVDVVRPRNKDMLNANVKGTRVVLSQAHAAGVKRVVHLSSIAAIGKTAGAADESTWNDGMYSGPYEESKHKAELEAMEAARRGLDVVHVLPSIVIGPGDEKSGAFFRRFLRGGVPGVPRPDGLLNLVYVDDLVDGLLLAFEKGQRNERYIFNQAIWSTSEFLERLSKAAGKTAPRRVPYGLAYMAATFEEWRARATRAKPRVSRLALRLARRNAAYSSEKARRELGWDPPPFAERFRQTIQYWAAKEGVRVPT